MSLFVLFIVIGIAITIWKVSTARRMARDAGMDDGDATAMALLSDDGFEATYLAANLRPRQPEGRSDRLHELQSLLDQGLITQGITTRAAGP